MAAQRQPPVPTPAPAPLETLTLPEGRRETTPVLGEEAGVGGGQGGSPEGVGLSAFLQCPGAPAGPAPTRRRILDGAELGVGAEDGAWGLEEAWMERRVVDSAGRPWTGGRAEGPWTDGGVDRAGGCGRSGLGKGGAGDGRGVDGPQGRGRGGGR